MPPLTPQRQRHIMDAGRGRLPPFRLAGAEAMARRAEALGAIGKALLFGDLAAVRAGAGAMAQAGASCRANLAADSTCADKLPSDRKNRAASGEYGGAGKIPSYFAVSIDHVSLSNPCQRYGGAIQIHCST